MLKTLFLSTLSFVISIPFAAQAIPKTTLYDEAMYIVWYEGSAATPLSVHKAIELVSKQDPLTVERLSDGYKLCDVIKESKMTAALWSANFQVIEKQESTANFVFATSYFLCPQLLSSRNAPRRLFLNHL